MFKPPRAFALAAFGAILVLGMPQAMAQSQAQPHAGPAAATAAPHAARGPLSLKWLREAFDAAKAQHASTKVRSNVEIGNFAQCPALPAGDNPADFTCGLIHITGGILDLGNAHQVINRNINISFGEGFDAKNNTILVLGSLKAAPMPSLGGIFLDPLVDNVVKTDPNLQLSVQPKQVKQQLDPTGNTALIISQVIKTINPVFGSTCVVGTKKAPVVLDPTFNTTDPPPPNQPESGHIDSAELVGNEIVVIGTVVDNAFAAPAAAGCGPSDSLDGVVNAVSGLPSPAGTNNAIFQVTVEAIQYSNL